MLNKLSQSFNRALIKRVDLLPNVSEFKTHRLGVHEYAAVYGIEKVQRSISVEKLNKGKPNKYLERVAFTLTKYAVNGQVCEYNKLSEITQRKSIAFRVLALNRTIDNWYTIPLKKLAAIWRSLNFICRTNSADLKFKRVWIDKKTRGLRKTTRSTHSGVEMLVLYENGPSRKILQRNRKSSTMATWRKKRSRSTELL